MPRPIKPAVLHDHVSGGEARNVLGHRKTFDRIGFAYADVLPNHVAGISDLVDLQGTRTCRGTYPKLTPEVLAAIIDGCGNGEQDEDGASNRIKDPVGQRPVLEVDCRERDQPAGEDDVGREGGVSAEARCDGAEEHCRAQLEQRVARRDRLTAVPAPAAQDQPRHDGDVVAGRDLRFAARTPGPRCHD